jgi:hypothetical protein
MAQRPQPVAVNVPEDEDPRNPYASTSRWRHQESTAFARHAAQQQQPRDAEARGGTDDLAHFLNKSRVAPEKSGSASGPQLERRSTPIMVAGEETKYDGRDIAVGPLLNYRRMEAGKWFGSVLVVTKGGGKQRLYEPTLILSRVDGTTVAGAQQDHLEPNGGSSSAAQGGLEVKGLCLYSDPRNTFWRFDVAVEIGQTEVAWQYTLPNLRFHSKTKPQTSVFRVPAISESMRVMFHSCNGFSVGTDEDDWSGAALWNDVLRRHAEAPFHVMLGGGDQIYNDGIRVSGPLQKWTAIGNPKKRREYPFPESLRRECDDYYLKNYIRWSGIPLNALA